MKIQTGRGTIPLLTLIAILSVSLVVNLPGLAISPILGELNNIFPGTSELEIQLLTILPNLFIIPFILLSGRLAISSSKVRIVVIALIIYLVSGIAYLFASSMSELIIISCALGIGCGLIIPLAAGLLTDIFVGKYRMAQLGIKSGVANLALVGATFAVGLFPDKEWHLPFTVYLIPLIPLLLSPFMARKCVECEEKRVTQAPEGEGKLMRSRIWGLVGLYFFINFCAVSIAYYLPFLTQNDAIANSSLGTITSLLYLGIFLPGFFLSFIVRKLKNNTIFISMISLAAGLMIVPMGTNVYVMSLGALLMGFGYGVMQPIIYDKAAVCATSEKKATLALAIVMSTNYLAITVTPFILDPIRNIVAPGSNIFPFFIDFALAAGFCFFIYLYRKNFLFGMDEELYK